MNGRTVKATVFNGASLLLGRTASELRSLAPSSQEQVVTAAWGRNGRFVVSIRTGREKPVVEQMLPYDEAIGLRVGRSGFQQFMESLISMFGFIVVQFQWLHRLLCQVNITRDANADAIHRLRSGVKTRRRRRVARPARETATERDYRRLKGSLKAQWTQTLKRKQARFVAEAEKSAAYRYGPKPYPPPETLFTVLLEGVLLLDKWQNTGFWAEHGNYTLQETVLEACVNNTLVAQWSQPLLEHIRRYHNGWPTEERAEDMIAACRALNTIFPSLDPDENCGLHSTMLGLRQKLVTSGIKYLQWYKKKDGMGGQMRSETREES
ncbi:hypothetical protein R1sor_024102 [Riccia sorocarpa]|uniref:Uncharacterized protein n=1 Tax=Riccia sorocarpa TaxID=122646 RepID=A0ABD3GTL4_9MARC